jgi:energy-coupling factor transporter ATP-binding protein EcfA2
MTIRIDRIKVNRGGPLENDFKLEPGDINLIYGHNETGKTYIVESIINLLFRTGRKSTIDWNLRGWDFAGNIIVSGIQDKPVTFSRTSKKLDDYWEEEIGLPQDFSLLLVVKEGETLLADEKDGVGRDILKNYLSGEGLLDRIEAGISPTLREANVLDGQIIGSNRGEIKKRGLLSGELEELDSLLKEAEDGYASGVIYNLRQKQETTNTELEMLKKAKCYYAARSHGKRKSLGKERENLPTEEELSQIESDISVYESKKNEAESKSDTLTKLKSTTDSYRWAEKALNVYKEITSGQAISSPKPVYMILALSFLAGAVVSGFLDIDIPLAISAAGSLVFLILHFVRMRRALATATNSKELEKLKGGFKSRYGSELTDRAVLEAQLEKLKEDYFYATGLKKDLGEELIPDLKSRESSIRGDLKKFTGNELPPQEWRSTISELRSKLSELTDKINSLDIELTSLAVSEEDLLYQDPGIEWDANRYKALEEELTEITKALDQEFRNLDQLRVRIAQETHLDSTEWEELITALRTRREEIAQEYRCMTAEILAKIQVNTIIQEFREEENARIAAGLESEELTKPLYAITECYKSIRHEVDRGLVLTTDEDEEYPLADVSTGAREQAFLAMRIGFSSIAMKGQTAFLILDDAFQHSDWPRRTNLMDQVLRLVKSGWQVFYFTMDDHIRGLFLKVGEKVGDRFRSLELH